MDVQIDNVSNMPTNYDYMNNIGTNPWSLVFLSGVIIVYYLIFATLEVVILNQVAKVVNPLLKVLYF